MARDHGRIYSSIWTNKDFLSLTGGAQRLYFLVLSQANLSYAGVIPFTARRWANLCTDGTPKALDKALDELVEKSFVLYDERSEELLVRSFLRHDGILKSPNMCIAMAKDYNAVLSEPLREAIRKEIPEPFPEPFRKVIREEVRGGFSGLFLEEVIEGSLTCACAPVPQPLPHPHPLSSSSVPRPPSPPVDNSMDDDDGFDWGSVWDSFVAAKERAEDSPKSVPWRNTVRTNAVAEQTTRAHELLAQFDLAPHELGEVLAGSRDLRYLIRRETA